MSITPIDHARVMVAVKPEITADKARGMVGRLVSTTPSTCVHMPLGVTFSTSTQTTPLTSVHSTASNDEIAASPATQNLRHIFDTPYGGDGPLPKSFRRNTLLAANDNFLVDKLFLNKHLYLISDNLLKQPKGLS